MPPEHPPAPGPAPEAPSLPAARTLLKPLRLIRLGVAGLLMGIANLIPGVSGGTMILAMGLYQEFIDSVADVTSLRLSLRRILFLGILGAFALAAIKGLAGVILYLLFYYPVAMYSLFIGLTLGGAPLLARMLRPIRAGVAAAILIGIGLMVGVFLLRTGGAFPHHAPMDVVAGLVGATTMVLPGVSGSFMLLVMDQYERVVRAVDTLDWRILIPVAIGGVAGIVGLSHLLKLLLRRARRATVGVLLGILLGSVIGLWPFGRPPGRAQLEELPPAELHAFAEHWRIPGALDTPEDQRVDAILTSWAQRGRSDATPGMMVLALAMASAGFAVTSVLGRARRADGDDAT